MRLYVGNLPFSATEDDLRAVVEQHGAVDSVNIIMDRETNRPRGFGFVDIADSAGPAAIEALNGYEMGGRQLRVNEAKDRNDRR